MLSLYSGRKTSLHHHGDKQEVAVWHFWQELKSCRQIGRHVEHTTIIMYKYIRRLCLLFVLYIYMWKSWVLCISLSLMAGKEANIYHLTEVEIHKNQSRIVALLETQLSCCADVCLWVPRMHLCCGITVTSVPATAQHSNTPQYHTCKLRSFVWNLFILIYLPWENFAFIC